MSSVISGVDVGGDAMGLSIVVRQLILRSGMVFIIKIIGALVRIPLFRWLGPEGVGLYQIIYSIYGLLLTIVTGGFPTALTLATVKNPRKGLQLLQASVIFLAVIGGLAGVIFHVQANEISAWLGDKRLVWAIRFTAPAIFIVPIVSLIRGFLQGIEYYGLIAISELIEQVARVITMLIFVSLWLKLSVGLAVGGVMIGAVSGATAALFFLFIVLFICSSRLNQPTATNPVPFRKVTMRTFGLFLRSSLALTASRYIVPLAEFLDALIIPHRLHDAGFTMEKATAIFGVFSGMAVSVVYLPTFVTSAVSHVISSKMMIEWKSGYRDRFHRKAKVILHLGWIWGIGSALFFFHYSDSLSRLLFGSPVASFAIVCMSAAPLISGMRDLSTTILWGEENSRTPMVGLFYGIIISSLLGYWLIGIRELSYVGTTIELLALEFISLCWNMVFLKRQNHRICSVRGFLREGIFLIGGGLIFFQLCGWFVGLFALPEQMRLILELFLAYGGVVSYVSIRAFWTDGFKI